MNLKKSEDSNARRLESLRLKAEEFKQKKKQITIDLHNLDSCQNNETLNKKIQFDDSDEEDNVKEMKKIKKKSKENDSKVSKKPKLIESSDNESDTEAENAKTLQMFENKINYNEKKANQLIQLKSKYSNEDGRFKIDDRFVDGSSSSEGDSEDAESESEKSGDEDENTEKAPKKPKKIISDEHLKKKLKKETQASLDILASITGKTARKPVDPSFDEKNSDKAVSTQKMVRYDPTKTEHKIFELLSDNDEYESEMKKLKSNKSDTNKVEEEDRNKNVDMAKYTKVDSNLKELFQSKDVFQFKFDNIPETTQKNTEWEKPTKLLENKFQKQFFNFGNVNPNDSSDSENENNPDKSPSQKMNSINKIHNSSLNGEQKSTLKKSLNNSNDPFQNNIMAKKTFLPLFDEDQQIKDALSYFCCEKDIDDLRKEWSSSREKMVEEYKKKHKRMLRIQKTKENEKIMTWRFKKN